MKLKKILVKINEFNEKQWLVFSIISTSVGLWFPFIVHFFGEQLRLLTKDQSGVLHWRPMGIILTIFTILWSFLSLLSKRYDDYRKGANNSFEEFSDENTLFQNLFNAICYIEDRETIYKTKSLDASANDIVFFVNYFQDQLERTEDISAQMCSLLSSLLSTKEYNIHDQDVVVNIYYRFPTLDNSWHRANNGKSEFGFSVEELASKGTTFRECIDTKRIVFHYSKQEAKKNNCYIFDSMDELKQGKDGSIACYYSNVKKDTIVYVEIVTAISTYGKRFAKYDKVEGNEESISNIKHNLYEFFFRLFDPYVKNVLFNSFLIEQIRLIETNKDKSEEKGSV